MSWQADWASISQRIQALCAGSTHIFSIENANANALKPVIEHLLIPQATAAFASVRAFTEQWHDALPPGVEFALGELIEASTRNGIWMSNHGKEASGMHAIGSRVIATLAIIRGEIDHLLADPSLIAVSVTERAFKHLQWMIVSDTEVRAKWQQHFRDGEPSCESSGATHLLLHGIWAYKAQSRTARTDIVMQEPVDDRPEIRRAARALVLTEWKRAIATTPTAIRNAARDGRNQASVYAGEMLAGFDLRSVRYVIVVTEDRITPPPDDPVGDITYRYLNLAVNPSAPHKSHHDGNPSSSASSATSLAP
jgi:hypothetical protein